MIKKVRIKLIAVTMFALLMVLGLILGAINVINYHNIVEEADQTLEILMENQGEFPQEGPPGKPPHWEVRNGTGDPASEEPIEAEDTARRIWDDAVWVASAEENAGWLLLAERGEDPRDAEQVEHPAQQAAPPQQMQQAQPQDPAPTVPPKEDRGGQGVERPEDRTGSSQENTEPAPAPAQSGDAVPTDPGSSTEPSSAQPSQEQTPPAKPAASQTEASSSDDSGESETAEETERDPAMEKERRHLSPETPYSARYFWVLLDEEGNVLETNTDRIISVDGTTAEDYAKRVWASGKDSGFYEDFRYAVSEEDEGIRVIFLDCYNGRLTFRRFLTASLGISALGMLAVFLLVALLSGRIIRPISESYEKQRRFITDAGHEIKTPLAIIDADAEVLEMDVGEDNEWVADIRQQIKRLTGLTNDLIFLSRMEEGSDHLLKTVFSYSEALEEIIQPFRSLAKIREKDLEIRIEEGVDFYGDEKSILQLASILMDNAMKYAPEHSTVSVRAGKNSRGVYLEVENAAPELRKTDIDHMFDRFYRADASRNSSQGGHGIGLSMARAITEAHGGKIHGEKVGEDRLKIAAVLPNKKPNNG